ncbi:hypothetical protein, variant 1 [Aphanomyces astaci]|uniref:Uncharacterized protein n=1 Tax=Aphanomyces astaci TaxID=112090 RepID=W4G5W2_APHAT|nr:hypothetical protein, variant 1 [Aphanomyces astaci]ETV74449.1 hypothetical protein, variant 1 [Aphanomyces astaci]|eukprot:XP_009836107.1 hypothetical protein, variant 1 [Aphanomyces astaci]
MNNADNDTNAEIQQLLREMHNMSSKKNPATHHPTALTYHGPRPAKSSPKTKKKASSTVHSHVHGKPLDLPHSGASSAVVDLPRNHGNLSFVQQLQVKYNQVKHALAIQHAQCGDLQAMVADLAAAKSHHTTQVATLEAALASRDREIHTLRDHVHDLYSVQQSLRAESLHKDIQLQQLQQQQRAAFVDDCHSCVCHSNAPSIAWSNHPVDAAAVVVPTTSCSSSSMPVDSSPVVHTLRVELQGLESQVACQSAELARVQKALGEAIDQSQVVEDAMRQWAAALALPTNNQSMEGGNNDETMHGLALVNLLNDAITVHVQRPPPLEPYSALQSRAVHPLTTNEPDDRALNDVTGGGQEGQMPQWLADALATVEDSMDEASHALDMEVLQMELASLRRSLQQKDDELDAFELMVDSMQGQVSALATHRDLVEERGGVQSNAVMDMLLQVIYNNQDEPEEGEHQRDVEVGNPDSCDEETLTTKEEQIQRNETWDHVEVYGTVPLDTQDMTLTLQLGIARSDEYTPRDDDVDGNREQRVVHSLLQNAIHVLCSSTTSSSISNDQTANVPLEATATHLLEQVTAHQRQFELLQEEVTATKLALDSKSTRLTQLVDEHASLSVRSEALEGELVQRMTDIGVLEHRLLDKQVTTTSLTRELSAATNALETLGHDSATLQAELLHQSRELADVRQRFQYVCSHLQADMAAFCAKSSVCHLLANDLVLGTVSSEKDSSMSSDIFLRNPDCLVEHTTDECGSALLGAFAAFKERVAGQLYSLEHDVETFKGRLSHAKATTAETVRYYEDQRAVIQAQEAAQALVHKDKDAMLSDRDDLIAQLRMDLETKVDASRSLTALVERELAACKHENHTLTTSVREITSEIVVLQGKLAAQSTCTARQQTARELQLQLAQGTTQSQRLLQVGRTTHQPLLATALRYCGESTDELMVAHTLDRVVLMCEWHGMFSALQQELASTKAQCHTLTSNLARDRNELDQCRQQLVQTREELTVAHEMQATHQDVMNMTTEMLKMNEDALEQSVAWVKLEAAESEKSICALILDKLVLQVQSIHDHEQHDLELSMAVDEWKQAYHDIENHGHDDHRQWNHMDTIQSRSSDRRSALSEAVNINAVVESAGFHQVLLGLKRCVVQEYARQKAVWMDSCRYLHDKVDAATRVSEQLREQCTSYETQLTSEREQHQYLARGWEDQHGQVEREVRHLESQLLDQATVHQHMVRTLECQQEHLKAECHTYESQVLELQTRLSQLEVEYTKKNQAQLRQETEQHDAVVRALECQLDHVNLACQTLNSKLLQQHEQHQLLVLDMEHRQEQLQAECSGWKTRLVDLSDQHQHIVNDLERRQAQLLQVECSNWEAKVAEKSEQHLAQVEALECQLEQLQDERRLTESHVGAQIDQHRRLVCDLQCRQDQIHQLEMEMATKQHEVGALLSALAASDSAKTLLQERCDAANAQSLLEVAACRSECQHLKTLLDQNRIEYDTFKADRLANEATLVASLQTEFKTLESTYEAQVEHWKTRVQSKDRTVSRLQHALWAMQLESELSLFQSKSSPSPTTTSVEDSPSPTLLVQGTPYHDDELIAVPQIADSFLKLGDDKTCQGGVFPQLEPTKRRRNNHRDSLWAIHQWRSAALEMEVQQEQYEMTLATSFQANETKSNQWQRTVEHNQAQYELATEQLKQQLDLAQTIASQKGKDSAKWVHALRSVQLEMDGALDRYQQVAHQVKTLTSLNDMHLRTIDDLAAKNKLLEGKSSALANQLAELSTLLTNERATVGSLRQREADSTAQLENQLQHRLSQCESQRGELDRLHTALIVESKASQERKQVEGKCAPLKSTNGTLQVERTASQCRIQHKRELKWRHYVQSMQLELDGCFPTAPSSAILHDAHTLLDPRTSTPHSVVTRAKAEMSQSRLNIADSARGLSRPSQSTMMMPHDLEWTWQVHEQVLDERTKQVHSLQAQLAMATSSPPMSPTSTTDPRLTSLKRRLDAATAENHALCTRLTDLTLDNHRLTVDLLDMRASVAAAESVEIPPTPTESPQRTDHPTTQTIPELLQCHFDTATAENDALRAQLRDLTLENHRVTVKLSENDKKTLSVAQATRHVAPTTQTPESASGRRQDSGTQTAESEPDGVDAATDEHHALCWLSTAQLSLDHHSCLMQDLRGGSNTQPTESGGNTVVESESESATPESTDREFASSNDVHAMYLSIPEAIDVPLITWKALANHIEELLSHTATVVAAIKQRPQQRRCLVGRLKRRLVMTLHTHDQHDPTASHPVVDVVHGLTSLGRLLATLLDPCTTTRATSFYTSVSIRSRRDTPFLTSLSTAAAPRRPVHRPLLHPSSSSIDAATTSFNGGGIVLLDVGATQVRASLLPLLYGTTTMSSPPSILRFENSTLDDKNDVAGKVAKALEWLGLSAAHLPFVKVVLLHKPRLEPSRKEHLTTLLLQGFQLQGVNLTTHTQVALTGHTGLVVDIGHTSTYLVPVFEDMVLEHAVVTLDGGGSAVASHILAHIRHTNPMKCFQAVSGTAHLAEIERSLMEGRREDDWPASISDVFFQGSVDLAMAVRACVKHCDPFLHPALFGNIVLTGGAAALPGLADRLKMELLANSTAAQEVHVQVVTNVFDGAASHAKNLSPYKWVLQEDFRLHGARIVHAKCF